MAVAIQLEGLRASIDPAALAQRRLVAQVEGGVLRVSAGALSQVLPRTRIDLEGIDAGVVRLRGPGFTAQVRPLAAPDGRLRLQVASVRLVGLLPVPAGLAANAARSRLLPAPGLYPGKADYLELDPNEAIREGTPPEHRERFVLVLPPVRAVRAEEGVLEVEF